MIHERMVETTEVSLRVASGPAAGPPLLFLHGVLRGWRDFVPLFPAVSTRWQAFAWDARGHGESARPTTGYRVVDYSRDAIELVTRFLPEGVVVYGHSLGAMVALAVAAAAPNRVRGLVMEDPPFQTMGRPIIGSLFQRQFAGQRAALAGVSHLSGGPDTPELTRRLAAIELTPPGESKVVRLGDVRDAAAIRFGANCLRSVDPAVFDPILDGSWLDGYDLDQLLPRVACPTLLLEADLAAGGMLRKEEAQRLERELRDCSRIRLPGVGHLIHWMETEKTCQLLLSFLESLER